MSSWLSGEKGKTQIGTGFVPILDGIFQKFVCVGADNAFLFILVI